MTARPAALYAGLDQLIARPTRKESAAASAFPVPPEPEPEKANTTSEEIGKAPVRTEEAESPANLRTVRQLDPEPPDSPALYRKQTPQFGPGDLAAAERLQAAMVTRGGQVGKNDLIRAAVEFLAKDYEAHQDDSYLVRKFIMRR